MKIETPAITETPVDQDPAYVTVQAARERERRQQRKPEAPAAEPPSGNSERDTEPLLPAPAVQKTMKPQSLFGMWLGKEQS